MKIYFSADCHFSHKNIIEYTKRPFKNVEHMNEEIVKRWNEIVKPNDLIYHLGDFAFKGVEQCQYWESRLNGKIVHIVGNHDLNNGVKSYITKGMMEFGNKVVFFQHHPPVIPEEIPEWADFVLCGHVHNHWKHKTLKKLPHIPIINVGVDVWNFTPVSTNSVLKYYDELIKKKKRKKK